MKHCQISLYFFFYNDTATTEIYTLSLHDALPIWSKQAEHEAIEDRVVVMARELFEVDHPGLHLLVSPFFIDRKSTRLNSSHMSISYAVFCLKKKKKQNNLLNIEHIWRYDIRLYRF